MIIPLWYRAKFSVKAVQLTKENFEDVKRFIHENSRYKVKAFCTRADHLCIFKIEGGAELGFVVHNENWIVVDAVKEVQVFIPGQFEFLYYQDTTRSVEERDVL